MFHDSVQFWWQLIALNLRKTRFRWRGGPPPCQSLGDSGLARETHCEACAQWNKIGRFRRVCPDLEWTNGGWRCGVHAENVRPYWGRAIGYYAAMTLGIYFGVTLTLFGAMRFAKFNLTYADIAWPPAWRHFDELRSRHYLEQGRAALAANHIEEARLELSLAYKFDPGNYEAGFTMAQLWQAVDWPVSNQVFAELLVNHPGHATETAQAWAHALLWRGDFARLARLAADRIGREPPPHAAWLRALIFSAEQLGDAAPLVATLQKTNLSGEARSLLQLEVKALGGDVSGAARILSAPLTDDASAFARRFQVRLLLRAGDARRGLELMAGYGDRMTANDRVALSLDALARLRSTDEVRREATALMQANRSPQIYEIIAAQLVRHPDAALLREVSAQFATGAWVEENRGMPANSALLCAAIVAGDAELADRLRARMRRVTASKAIALGQVEALLSNEAERRKLRNLLPALPLLPLEVVYAIFERDADARRQP